MNLRIGAFKHQVVTACYLVLTVDENPAFNCCHVPAVQHFNWQALIGHQDTMRRQHLLTISRSLHRSEYRFEITSDAPGTGIVGDG